MVERDGATIFPGHDMRIVSVIANPSGTLDVSYEITPALSEAEGEALLPFGFVAEGTDAAGGMCVDMGGAFGPKGDATAGTVSVKAPHSMSVLTLRITRAQHADLLEGSPDWRLVIEHPC